MESVITLKLVDREDYDSQYSIDDREIKCYSKEALKKRHPDGNYLVIGETFEENKKDKIANITLADKELAVSELGANFKPFYRRAGYIEVGKDAYIALLKNQMAFVLILCGLLLGILITAIIALFLWLTTPAKKPDYILPTEDDQASNMENDHSKKSDSDGGSVTLGYSLEAKIDLSSGAISILLQNPNASNKDMMATLYIQAGDLNTPIARSGLIKAGKELKAMTLNLDGVLLQRGNYKGYFLLDFYDPDSGAKDLMNSKVDNVKITVN
ncbi:MAG: hypothetical protein IJ733_12760 [Lachnospiraceae bacterium]|nr:hypothetical protein [Lachnospiraceae bacterium]